MNAEAGGPGGADAAGWRRLEAAFDALVAEDAAGRADRLAALRREDPPLAAAVVELLAADAAASEPPGSATVPSEPDAAGDAGDAGDPRFGPGTRIGRFRLVRRVAAGGMGVVYEAEQDHPRRRIALKLVRPGRIAGSLRRRFELEGRILARLQHPGIAAVHDAGSAIVDGAPVPYLAMEFVDGASIVGGADAAGLDLRARIELLARVADAVQHAHQRGVIHRDLKPANILLVAPGDRPSTASSASAGAGASAGSAPGGESTARSAAGPDRIGQPKVLDFGVARLLDPGAAADADMPPGGTLAGQVIGTVPYMSPEQLAGDLDAVDTRTDVFALGVVGYELFTGRLPHETRDCSPAEAARRLAARPAPRPSSLDRAVRGDVEQVLLKAVAREPDRRYAAAGDLADDLRRVLRREPVVARAPSAWYHLTSFARRHVAGVIAAGIVVLMAAGAATSVTLALLREQDARAELATALDGERTALTAERDAVARLERDRRTLERTVDFLGEEVLAAAVPGGDGFQGLDTPIGVVLDRATRRVGEAWSDDPMLESEIRELLAGAWRSLGKPARAIEEAERSLALRAAVRDADDEWVIAAHHNLAGAYIDAGRPAEAIPHVEAAIAGLEQREDLQARLVSVRSGHTSMLIGLGRFDAAIEQGEAAVALAGELLEPGAESRLVAHQNLGVALQRAGRVAEALPHALVAYEGSLQTRGPEDPGTVMRMDTVGGLHGELGDHDAAAGLLEEALAIKRRLLGDEHPQTVMSMVSLGRLEIRRERMDAAVALLREAIDTAGRVRGPDDSQRLLALNALGMVLRAREDWAAAEELHEDLLAGVLRALGPRHPASIIVRASLAEIRLALGRPAEAAALLDSALEDAGADGGLPASHSEWVRLHRLRARAHAAAGDLDAAEAAWGRALGRAESIHGPDDRRTQELRAEATAATGG